MKTRLLGLALVCALLLSVSAEAQAEGLVSMRIGVFYPGNDYSDAVADGGDYGIYYTNVSSTLGFEVGMHGYSLKGGGEEIGVTGLEAMIIFQSDPSLTFQSYAGFGFGVYGISYDPAIGPQRNEDGTGAVLQLGIRSFMETLFMGLQVKGFTNTWGGNNDMDLGGYSTNIVLGMVF